MDEHLEPVISTRPATGDFTWDLVPDPVCDAIAAELDHSGESAAAAREHLTRHHPFPDDDLLRRGRYSNDVAHAIRSTWPPLNPLVLEHLYGLVESAGLVPVGKRRPSRGTMLRRLQELTLHVNYRRALLDTLLRFGSRTLVAEALQDLPSFFVVPTDSGADPGELFPHQVEAVRRLRNQFSREGPSMRGLVVMPTGSGKTRTAVSWLLDDVVARNHKVLWVTHRTELMEQTARAFIAASPRLARHGREGLAVRLVGGGFSPGTTIPSPSHDVVIASVATLARSVEALRSWLKANDVVVVFDEAHHSPAKTWRDILKLASETTNDAVVGLTATPTRMDEAERRALIHLYGGEGDARKAFIHESRADDLIDQEYLARPNAVRLDTRVDVLEDANEADLTVLETFGTLSPRLATQLATHSGRNKLIVDTWLHGPAGDGETYGQSIVFAINTPHAELLAERFGEAGGPAAAVHTHRGADENRQALDAFRRGELKVLVNVEMLTEGIDVPNVRTVFLARPTRSPALFNQMVGRAMRGPKVGGTKDAYVVDLHDLWSAFPPVFYTEESLDGKDSEPPTTPTASTFPVPGLLELALAAGRILERLSTSAVLGRIDLLPTGVLTFRVDAAGDDDAVEIDRTLVVYAHQEVGFDRIRELVDREKLAMLRKETDWREAFFDDLPTPAPGASELAALRRHVLDTGEFPSLHRFVERDALDPRKLAERLAQEDRTVAELNAEIDRLVAKHAEVVDHAWGSGAAYAAEVVAEINRVVRGDEPLVPERRPALRVPDLSEWRSGAGVHDLQAVVDELLRDPELFRRPMHPPDRIQWSKDGRGHWGLYTADDRGTRIVINILLDSPDVDPRVVSALVFHELLHHEQFVEGRRIVHGPEFHKRQDQHPDILFANMFLDTFAERFPT